MPLLRPSFSNSKQIQKHFGDSLRFVFRHFPLTQAHPIAEPAAEAAEFSNEYDKFWEMHDLVYANQQQLSLPFLLELAKSLDLPEKKLEISLQNGEYKEKIKSDFLGGIYSGVNGTPTFFINGDRHTGFLSFDALVLAINNHL